MWLIALAGTASASPTPMVAAPVPEVAPATSSLQPAIDAAAASFAVPEVLLSALVWEASRYDPTVARAWAGYGPLDLREGHEPNVEHAAILLGVSADALIADPAENVRGGAAILAEEAARSNGGIAPDPDDLEAWWPATKVFSGSHDPEVQRMFARYVYDLVWYGVDAVAPTGEAVRFGGVPVDIPSLLAADGVPVGRLPHYGVVGSIPFVPACGSNYTNDSRSGSDISYVVIHTTQGSYAGTISWFQNCSAAVSAHYVVRSSDGEITQMVSEQDIAWHAGNWSYNEMSIGIEHEGFVEDPNTWYTDAMYQASAALTADIVSRTNVLPDRNHIIGHVEVPGSTHTDPGSGWDWTYYMSLVDGTFAVAADLTGVIAVDDIFTGERIPGASVTVVETGDAVVVGDDGVYLFQDLPEGDYTVIASAPGYTDGECETTIDASGTFWCSIALFEAADPTTSQPPGTAPDPASTTGVTSAPTVPLPHSSFAPEGRTVIAPSKGCGCAAEGGVGGFGLSASAASALAGWLVRRRRDRARTGSP